MEQAQLDRRDRTRVEAWWCSAATRAFLEEARQTPNYTKLDTLHGYVYGRWPYLYIGIGTGEHWLAKVLGPLVRFIRRLLPKADPAVEKPTHAEGYHGKVVTLEAARRLVSVNEDISLRDLEQVIPYTMARDIILKNPDHIVALKCPCRSARSQPCTPLDVCLIVGEPFASFVAEHHASRSRWITQAQAAEILEQEHLRGHVHHAFFKDAMFGRFYAICNCCPCCCGAMQSWMNGTPMLASSGYLAQVNHDWCIGCGSCQEACPFGAMQSGDGLACVDMDICMGCGVCAQVCEQRAISLVIEPSKGIPLEIHELVAQGEGGGGRSA